MEGVQQRRGGRKEPGHLREAETQKGAGIQKEPFLRWDFRRMVILRASLCVGRSW